MSPLPERRKTPEELAELRESLGIPTDQPTEEASTEDGDDGSPEPAGESEPAAEPPSEPPPARVEHDTSAFRKTSPLTVDQPKERVTRGEPGALPVRRRSEKELREIQRQAMATRPQAEALVRKRLAAPLELVGIYGVGVLLLVLSLLAAISWSVDAYDLPFDWLRRLAVRDVFRWIVFGLFAACGVEMLGGALWLALKRPLSRHHAGFLTLIAALVLIFSTLYCFPGLYGA